MGTFVVVAVDIACIPLDSRFVHRIAKWRQKNSAGSGRGRKCPCAGASLHCNRAVIATKRIARATKRIAHEGFTLLCLRRVAAQWVVVGRRVNL